MFIPLSDDASQASLDKSPNDHPSKDKFSIILILLFAQIILIIYIGFAWILEVLRHSDAAPAEELESMKHLTSKNVFGSSSPTSKSASKIVNLLFEKVFYLITI